MHAADRVGVADRRESMSDANRRPVLHQPVDRLLHDVLRFGVERGGRLVEQQHLGVDEQRTRDRDALLLPARELHAALADHRVVAFRETADEVVSVGGRRGGGDGLVALDLAAVGDVGADRRGEEHGLLRDEGDLPPPPARIE